MVNALISVVAYDSCLFLPLSLEEQVSNDKGTSLGLGTSFIVTDSLVGVFTGSSPEQKLYVAQW